jgi:hypothetical protein
MLQEKRIKYEAIKIYCLERWPDFCRWRRGASGHPQALKLIPLGYFLGLHGHPQALSFVHTLSHLITLHSLHLKTSFIQNFTQFY